MWRGGRRGGAPACPPLEGDGPHGSPGPRAPRYRISLRRRLRGVDVWTDAMAAGIELEVQAAGPDASFTLTPVWMDTAGVTESWTGADESIARKLWTSPQALDAVWNNAGLETP